MPFHFRPARSYTDRRGCFIALTGSTNSGKTYSALRLARGIAGPKGKIAVLDTEGGRTLHLKDDFDFDASIMEPPFRPQRFAEAAQEAEEAGYDVLLTDSFTMEWRGIGGILDWEEAELQRLAGDDFKMRERRKQMARIPGRMAHKAMVFSFLQRKMPIIFSIRGEETITTPEAGGKPEKIYKSQCSPSFPFEMTLAFRLASDRKGYIDLSDTTSWKMEAAHQAIFKDGDRLSEEHGAKIAQWARGEDEPAPAPDHLGLIKTKLTKAKTRQDVTKIIEQWGAATTKAVAAERPIAKDVDEAVQALLAQAYGEMPSGANSTNRTNTELGDGVPAG